MADGLSFEIGIQAEATGVDASANAVTSLADAISAAAHVTTPFDAALAAARGHMEAAGAAAVTAGSDLRIAERAYGALEKEAIRAGKALDKAAAAGKDTTELVAAAERAKAAVASQTAQLDKSRSAAAKASAAYKQLSDSHRVIAAAARNSASAVGRAKESAAAEAVALDKSRKAAADAAKAHEKLAHAAAAVTSSTQKSSAAAAHVGMSVEKLTPKLDALSGKLGIGSGGGAIAGVAGIAAIAMLTFAKSLATAGYELVRFAVLANPAVAKALGEQYESLKSNIKGLFSDVDSSKLVGAFARLVALFDAGTASGATLRRMVTSIVQSIVDATAAVAPYLAEMFKGAVWGAVKFQSVVLRLKIALLQAVPKSVVSAIKDLTANIDWLDAAFKVGAAVVGAFAIVIGLLVSAATPVISTVMAVGAALSYLWDLCTDGGKTWGELVSAISGAVASIVGVVKNMISSAGGALSEWASDAYIAASEFIMGIVQGIGDGISAVAEAAKGVAQGAVDAVTSALGIASPSKVMIRAGKYTAEGFGEGLDRGTDGVRAGVERMVSPLDAATGQQSGAVEPRGGGQTITFGPITINAPSGDGEDIRDTLRRYFIAELDGLAVSIGGGEVPSNA